MNDNENIVPEYWKNTSLEDIRYVDPDGIECVERWLPIKGYEGLYEISDCGRVKSLKRIGVSKIKRAVPISERILVQNRSTGGYVLVSLCDGVGGIVKVRIHNLVCRAFINNPQNKKEGNHMFGIKTDNRACTLEWLTRDENREHAISTGLIKNKGEDNKSCKLDNTKVLNIFASTERTSILAKRYNVSIATIKNIRNGRLWSHLTGKIKVTKNGKNN